jgi:two-component system cell cycle sensor histidine kinase/response regulator CckA
MSHSEDEIRKLISGIEQSIDGMAIGDTELNLLYVNDAFAKMHGYSPEEMIGLAAVDLQHPADASDSRAIIHYLSKQGSWSGKTMHSRKDSDPFPGYLSVTALKDAKGNPAGTFLISRDMDDQENLEAKCRHTEKLDALGTFAGGVAHNFNNLLMAIMGNASLALLTCDPDDEHYDALKRIQMLVEKGAQLTQQLLVVAGNKGTYEFKPVALDRIVVATCDAFATIKDEITVYREFAEDLWRIEADASQIEQALWNLFVNAADAMPDGGALYVKTMNATATHKELQGKVHNPKPGNYIRLSLADTGTGMDRETRERLFDPFFSTKDLCSGTGLGLAFVHGVIKAHGGYIDINSEKGRGTVFDIYLPALNGRTTRKKEVKHVIPKGNGRILLIDDEEMILNVGKDMLTRLGYEVLLAGSGDEALGIYEKNKDAIALIILDMIMPNMSGEETYDKLREQNPDVKILLSSGYSIDGQASRILERGCDAFIQKPFTVTALSRKLKEVLDGS